MTNIRYWSFAVVSLVFFIHAAPTASFLNPTTSPGSPLMMLNHHRRRDRFLSANSRTTPITSSLVLKSSETNQEDDNNFNTDGSIDIGGILGSFASIVVLYSEFVLKTTGCGLPAGPFGLVGAVEGVSYLGVVATCATAAVDYFSEDGLEGSEKPTRRLATALGLSAAVVGITVLAFQVLDYGYIPNAVPMEGGMCK